MYGNVSSLCSSLSQNNFKYSLSYLSIQLIIICLSIGLTDSVFGEHELVRSEIKNRSCKAVLYTIFIPDQACLVRTG